MRRLQALFLILTTALAYGCVAGGGDEPTGSIDQVLSGPWVDPGGTCTDVSQGTVKDNHENCSWTCFKRCKGLSVNWSAKGVPTYPNQLWNQDGTPQDCQNDPACAKIQAECASAAPGQCTGLGGPRSPAYDFICVPTGSNGNPLCSAHGQPPLQTQTKREKSYGMRFDVVTFNGLCSSGLPLEKNGRAKCFACDEFNIFNQGPPHFITMPGDVHAPQVWAQGNALAAYVNSLTDLWGGKAGKLTQQERARKGPTTPGELMQSLSHLYACGVPAYIILNEISRSVWVKNPKKCPAGGPCMTYRQYVVHMAHNLRVFFGKHVIVASPFWYPINQGKHPALKANWAALGRNAYIAIEANELDGPNVYNHKDSYGDDGDPVTYCKVRYKMMLSAYHDFGIPYRKLMIVQNFSNTCNATAKKGQAGACCKAREKCAGPGPYGRFGISIAKWKKVVHARDVALKNLLVHGLSGRRFAGFLSYGWGGFWGKPHGKYINERHAIMNQYVDDWKSWK